MLIASKPIALFVAVGVTVGLAGCGSTARAAVDENGAQRAIPRGEVTESHTIPVTWSQLRAGAVSRSAATTFVNASPYPARPAPPFFRLLRMTVSREESPTALDSTGVERPCGLGVPQPDECWRLRVAAVFTLASPLGLATLARNPPVWCFNVLGAGGVVSTLAEQIGCQSSWVSLTWPRVASTPIGALPVFVVEDVSHGREEFVLSRTSAVQIRLASGSADPPCPQPVPTAGVTGERVEQLDPSIGIYEALGKLSPKDERWDQLLRRVEQQRAGLRKHAKALEEAAYDVVYIYVTAYASAALQIVVGPALRALRRPPTGCTLTPAQREVMILRNMRRLKELQKREVLLRKTLMEASARPNSPRVRAAVRAIERELRAIADQYR